MSRYPNIKRKFRVPRYDGGGGMFMEGMGNMPDATNETWSWVAPYEKYWATDRFEESGFDAVKAAYEKKKKNALIKSEAGRQVMGVVAGLLGTSAISDEVGIPIDAMVEDTAVGQTEGYQATTGTERVARGIVKMIYGPNKVSAAGDIVAGGGDFADLARIQGVRKGNFKMYKRAAISGDVLRTGARVLRVAGGIAGQTGGNVGGASGSSSNWMGSYNKAMNSPYAQAGKQIGKEVGGGIRQAQVAGQDEEETDYGLFKYGGSVKGRTFLPIDQNADGTKRKKLFDNVNGEVSTESVIGIGPEADGKYYNIPTVVNGKRLSEKEAIEYFRKTGEHTGVYDTQQEADAGSASREKVNIALGSTGLYKYGGNMKYCRVPKFEEGGGMPGMGGGGGNPVSGIIGMIVNAVKAKKARKKAAEDAAIQEEHEKQVRGDEHRAWSEGILNTWDSQGVGNVDYYAADGGTIHINPKNRGKFTAYAKAHGMGVQEMAAKVMANKGAYSPTIVKRANFARNASGWSHAYGGNTDQITPQTVGTRGGKLIPLSDDEMVVLGDTHGQDSNKDGDKGVTLSNEHGQDFAEVEHGEVVTKDGDVHSRRVMLPNGESVAENTSKWAIVKKDNQLNLVSSDRFKRGTAERNIEKGNIHIANNFKYQEMVTNSYALPGKMKAAFGGRVFINPFATNKDVTNKNYGRPFVNAMGGKIKKYDSGGDFWSSDTPSYATAPAAENFYSSDVPSAGNTPDAGSLDYGQGAPIETTGDSNFYYGSWNTNYSTPQSRGTSGKWINYAKMLGKGIGQSSRFIDNIANAAIPYPNVRPPYMRNYAYIPTKYNISPTIAAMKEAAMNSKSAIDRGTAQSNTARATKLGIDAKLLASMNLVYQDKAEKELVMQNNAANLLQTTNDKNASEINQYLVDQFNRDSQIRRNKVANWADVGRDIGEIDKDAQANANASNELRAYSTLSQGTGNFYEMMGNADFDQSMFSDKATARKFSARLSGDKKKKWDIYYGLK